MAPPPSWAVATMYWLHMLATVAWSGSIFALTLLIHPVAKKKLNPVDHLALVEGIQTRLEPIAWFSLSLLTLTGLFQMSVNPHYDGFASISTQWSSAILIKHIIGVLMIVTAAIQTWDVIPSIRRLLLNKKNANIEQVTMLEKKERNLIRMSFILSVLVLLATAVARIS